MGHGKADVVREAALKLEYKSDPNADRGEGVKKSYNFADIISGAPLAGHGRRQQTSLLLQRDGGRLLCWSKVQRRPRATLRGAELN